MNNIFIKYSIIFYLFSFMNLEFSKGNANSINCFIPYFYAYIHLKLRLSFLRFKFFKIEGD